MTTDKKAKIFVVEDDPIIFLDIQSILTNNGYTVVGHSDRGEDAVKLIPEAKPDLILMDVNLRGEMDGIEAATLVSKSYKCPLIFLTALSDEETLARAKLAQPFGYVVKPFEDVDITTSIEIALMRFETEVAAADSGIQHDDTPPEFINLDPNSSLIPNQIRSIKIFSNLEDSFIEEIASSTLIKSFSPGDIIVSQENKEHGFIVLSGRIGIVSTSISGKDLISSLLGPGDCYGLFFLLEDFSEKVYAKAQAESKILIIPLNLMKHLQKSSKVFNQQLISELTSQLSKNISISQALAFSKVEGRIINALIALLPSFGKKAVEGEQAGRLFITRKELADFTGTTPETAIRVTKSLERRGLLDLTKPGIIKVLNIEELKSEAYD